MRETGLFELLEKHIVNNLVDYCLGVETGLDSNGRKPGNYEYRKRMIRAWLLKYRDYVSCKEELAEVINRKFKVGIKFVGSKDSPYGYMVIDHKAGIVFK